MKSPDPVTIYDLECSARDAKNGECEYEGVKVYWDDALNGFAYYNGPHQITRERVIMKMGDYSFFDVMESLSELMVIAVAIVCAYGFIVGVFS